MEQPKKQTTPRVRVEDAHRWQDMAGDTDLEKMLNAYMTCQFILHKDVPADECLMEAKKIIAIVQAYGESADPGAAWDVLGREKFK
jgi:hypothetical protein